MKEEIGQKKWHVPASSLYHTFPPLFYIFEFELIFLTNSKMYGGKNVLRRRGTVLHSKM